MMMVTGSGRESDERGDGLHRNGATATAAKPISLAEAGFKEREHLQEWVIANPEVLGADVKIVAFEYGRWSGSGGTVERDRIDVLGLDCEGRLVELKRDKAPDTADMQALKCADHPPLEPATRSSDGPRRCLPALPRYALPRLPVEDPQARP
jgi:hypothetical protein